jgi:CBS domain-containing protein
VSAFPVLDDDNKVLGVVSEADPLAKPPVTIGPHEPASHAARLMYSRKVKRLPVVDDRGRLIGNVSRADVLSVFARPDAEIRMDIIENVIIGTAPTRAWTSRRPAHVPGIRVPRCRPPLTGRQKMSTAKPALLRPTAGTERPPDAPAPRGGCG